MKGRQEPQVPTEHLQGTIKLMELFQMDMNEAYLYLKSMDHQLENAITLKLDPHIAPRGLPNPLSSQFSRNSEEEQFNQNLIGQGMNSGQRKTQRQSKRDDEAKKKSFKKTYLIKKVKPSRKRATRRKKNQTQENQKMLQQFDFIGALSKLIEGEVYVSFASDIYDTFKNMWDKRKLVALHCIKFVSKQELVPPFEQILEFTKQIYKNPQFVETFNKYLINYGLDLAHFDFNHYPFMRQLIEEGDQYKIILLRYNQVVGKVELVRKMPFNKVFKFSEPHLFQTQIRQIQRNSVYRQSAFEKLSSKQRKQIQEDRLLRQQQQEQYFKQMNAVEEKMEKPIVQPSEKQDISEVRKRNRDQLKIYQQDIPNAINLKVRLPNSQFTYFKLPKTQIINYLFTAIENHEKDIGFFNQSDRQFDILVPLERISLLEKKCETFQSIFGSSEMESLVVKEL